jgi:hypothetical protein
MKYFLIVYVMSLLSCSPDKVIERKSYYLGCLRASMHYNTGVFNPDKIEDFCTDKAWEEFK